MGEPYLAEIFMGGWNFAPRGFSLCNGQLLPITQNTAVFSLLGTTFGGDGQITFALPDLRGRVPIHWGQGPGLSNYNIGELSGAENVTLLTSQMPSHNHVFNTNQSAGTTSVPGNATYLASGPLTGSGPNATALKTFTTDTTAGNIEPLIQNTISAAGGGQPHSNIQPFLSISFVIALQGIFPARN